MGLKKLFSKKQPTQEEVEEQLQDRLSDQNIPTKKTHKDNAKNKHQLFAAYGNFANDKTRSKVFAPKGYESHSKNYDENDSGKNEVYDNTYDNSSSRVSSNPYNNQTASNSSNIETNNPYGNIDSNNPYGTQTSYNSNGGSSNPYSDLRNGTSSNPYNNQSSNAYSNSSNSNNQYSQQSQYQQNHQNSLSSTTSPSYAASSRSQPYTSRSAQSQQFQSRLYRGTDGSQINSDPYSTPNNVAVNEEEDLNYNPNDDTGNYNSYSQQEQEQQQEQIFKPQGQETYYSDYDLNADVIAPPRELTEEEIAQIQEDEEVEKIKSDIRFTKQESVASTRNTLRMAREAEDSGKNTMGMLGNQSETMYNTEKLLSLAETQEKISKAKIAELNHYNRNILKPNVSNPFTKSRRLRQKEEQIKQERLFSKLEAERQRQGISDSTNRVKNSLTDGSRDPESVGDKYRREKILQQAKQYQFENDEEDDQMELEIGENLNEIDKIAGRLKKLAMNQSEELDRQSNRMKEIEEKTDKLDINIHVNTSRLQGRR
ncbi:hypothetical protein WICMUC_004455 [Wickerhamomyces mucosus]|uniref:t-SNARE coiled-coil homology domain-containing protein n=1 Tax=Wickerhamomyces mucosus TaxID=1378264 RepID=A0A9P8PIM8_9ASCO|nr:hypothetical protein WICMUC_004455 [Wickerhamomyces mucosus]